MSVDLSRIDRMMLDSSIRQARKLQDQGMLLEAVNAWEVASSHAESYAGKAKTSEEKERRLKTASEFQAIAEVLRRPNTDVASQTATRKESRCEYRRAARKLVVKSDVNFEQIAGLTQTKDELKLAYALSIAAAPEGVVLPKTKNILLYGPPGCGKTLLAAAVSHSLQATFFNVKVGDLMSKYFGESSKLAQAVYEEARNHGNAVVFLDEFDAIAGTRDKSDNGSERRLLVSLLTELDGLNEKDTDSHVLTIAATNSPWSLDDAIVSRFEKQVLIPIPDVDARCRILELQLTEQGYLLDFDIEEIADKTCGLSGREIEHLAKLMKEQMIAESNQGLLSLAIQGADAVRSGHVLLRSLTSQDFDSARARIRPAVRPEIVQKFKLWGERNAV